MQESQLFKEKYTIQPRVLGAGSQGSVHLAVNTASKTQLVCKIINMKQAGIRDQHSLFVTANLEKAQHPHLRRRRVVASYPDEGERPLPTQLPDVLEQSQPRRLSDTVDFQQLAIAQYVQTGRVKVAQDSSVMPNNNRQRVVKVRRQAQQWSNQANKPPKGRIHDGRVEILEKLKSTNTRFLKE
ncbi:hypothetical protein MY1884_000918 [Beauveria asiatica]